ncbi:ATP-binding protein [uncultured Pseudodesulfovibrio sp.]|uniref:ATP-binding protein n=1 Tax=uncultured Pseudodesulfovibrio sp. TaxID=2035858 RepID=UPI0029C64642|nr:ATP-binding protein [uncultured Pseudodesulfovibrio sp.]
MPQPSEHHLPVKRWTFLILVCWTCVSLFFLEYSFHLLEESTLAQVHTKAQEAFNKDQSFRFWATMHGGVYVPITEATPPNKYLSQIKERDITTPSGRKLTLMNPAYMVRQLNDSFGSLYGAQGHITSLKPLRPENAPDDWERMALHKFENGAAEVYEIQDKGGERFARLMQPMAVTPGCLKCHAHQGYKVGDVRGGVSVSVPIAPFLAAQADLKFKSGLVVSGLWFFGACLVLFGSSLLAQNFRERDILTRNLETAKTSAEAANSAKSVFLANMSHEIRTPLNGIMGMLQLFQSTPLTSEQSEYVDAALQSSQRLTFLLSDILDLSMIEKGVLTFRHEPVEIASIVDAIRTLFTVAAKQKGIDFVLTLDPDVPQRIMSDPTRLQQLLTNLVGNAMKFTPKGRVQLTVHNLKPSPSGQCRLLFVVSDTGEGIADDKITHIFSPFAQASEGYTRNYQGAGLGLAICNRLVDAMGGSLSVSSKLGLGTEVYCSLTFDLVPGDEAAIPDTLPDETRHEYNMAILLAEDDNVSRIAAERLLSKYGCHVTCARDGREALDILKDAHFDLVVMDIQMPVMNGLESTRAIRNGEAGEWCRSIPIIAMTAYAMDSDRKSFDEAGMDGYIPKPVDHDSLLDTLRKYSSSSRP